MVVFETRHLRAPRLESLIGPHSIDRNTAVWDEEDLQRWRLTDGRQDKEVKAEHDAAVLADDERAFVLQGWGSLEHFMSRNLGLNPSKASNLKNARVII